MRGIDPIEGLNEIREVPAPVTLESVLTPDELIAIEGMRRNSKDIRRAWLLIGKELCKNTPRIPRTKEGEQRITLDRRRAFTGMKYRNPAEPGQEQNGGIPGEPKKA